ncbi:MAG: hypothetical protein QW076_02120 [Candidatus Anstonellales archaeon]
MINIIKTNIEIILGSMNKRLFGLLLLIIAIGILLITTVSNNVITSEEEKKVILEDLISKFPNSKIEEIGISKSDGNRVYSFYVIKTESTLCPERFKVDYIYPKNHFVPEILTITSNCEVCKNRDNNLCVIAFPEEAVIASHKFNKEVKAFLEKSKRLSYNVVKYENFYEVKWTNELNETIVAIVDFNGDVQIKDNT